MRMRDFTPGCYWVRMPNGEWNRVQFATGRAAWEFFRMPGGKFASVSQQLGIDCWCTPHASEEVLDGASVPKFGRIA